MVIIGISGKAGFGKDTAAQIIKEELESIDKRVKILHYADLLKWMCKTYFDWNGEKDDKGRTLLQHVGTDVIRQQQPEFWVNWIIQMIEFFPDLADYILIPDCRFPNELEALNNAFKDKFPVKHFRVVRPNYVSQLSLEQQQHPSETSLDNYPYDVLIKNTSLEELRKQIQNIIKAI